MQRYEPLVNRPIFGIAAVALTALTIATMVVGPTALPAADHATALYGGAAAAPMAREVTIAPSSIDVVVARDAGLAIAGARAGSAKLGRRG